MEFACGVILACGICFAGLRLIQAAGLIEDISLANILKIVAGLCLVGLSFFVLQVALNILDFGKVPE